MFENDKIKGLSSDEAFLLLKKNGKNDIKQRKKPKAIFLFLSQFKDTLVIILLFAIVASFIMGDIVESIAILIVVLINGMFGFFQEYKTEKTLDELKKLSAHFSKVIRDGAIITVKSEEIVVGDVLVLGAGDRVPADCVFIKAENYTLDESMLTGESEHIFKNGILNISENLLTDEKIRKKIGEIDKFKEDNKGYMGSMILSGSALGYCLHTGMDTQMGKIAKLIDDVEFEGNTLQKKLNHLGKYIAIICLTICSIVTLMGIVRGMNVFDMLLAGISLAVASIPESLPAVVMVALAIGVGRMLKKNALIKKLPAVETLGVANIICSDKTGTLTENRMDVKALYVFDNEILDIDMKNNKFKNVLNSFFQICLLCNNARITDVSKDNEDVNIVKKIKQKKKDKILPQFEGDSLEVSLLKSAIDVGIDVEEFRQGFVRKKEISFDSEKKYMGVVVTGKEGKFLLIKGAPEIVVKKCRFVKGLNGDDKLTDAKTKRILRQNDKWTLKAFRVIAFAYKRLDTFENLGDDGVNELTFVALAGITDPPRADVAPAIKKINECGIRTVMITGDHKNTATAIAKQIGLFKKNDEVLTGEELDCLKDKELLNRIDNSSVFARVTPSHKLKIVSLLKSKGYVVAMTGDGVNDAPAVKKADIGIAMGKNGTDVTREAASIILLDDKFSSISDAVIEGRIIYLNIRKAILYLLTCNVGEVVTMLFGSIIGFPVILLPIQILWVNLVTDGLPAIGLACDMPDEQNVLENKKYNSNNIFYDGLAKEILVRGFTKGFMVLGVFCFYMYTTFDLDISRSNAFLTMIIAQLIFALECRGFKGMSFKFFGWVGVSFILALGVLYVQIFRDSFSLVVPSFFDWCVMFGVCAGVSVFFHILKRKLKKGG